MTRHPGDLVRFVTGAAVFAVSAWLVRGNRVGLGETALFTAVNRLPGVLEPPLVVIMQAGSLAAVGAVAGMAAALRRTRLAVDVVLAGGGTWLLVKAVKEWVARLRPDGLIADVVVRGAEQTGLGFPSGHVAVAAALATAAGPWLPRPVRRVTWVVVGVVALARVYVGAHLPLDVVGGAGFGWMMGAGVHLLRGAPGRQPTGALVLATLPLLGVRGCLVRPLVADARGSCPFVTTTQDDGDVFVKVVGREQRDADLLFKLYRFVAIRGVEDEAPFATPKQVVEHEAYLGLLAERAGVNVPAIIGAAAAEDGSGVLVQQLVHGRGLDAVDDGEIDDALLRRMWQQVALLQRHRIAHRDLRLANWLADEEGGPWLTDFGFAEAAASPRRLAQDVAELLAGTAARVGPERAVAAARAELGADVLTSAAALLQPLALSSATRKQVHGGALDRVRAEIARVTGQELITPTPVSRLHVRPRTVVGLAVIGFAVHALLPQVAEVAATWRALADARLDWLLAAAVLSAMRYPAAAAALMGAVPAPLGLARTTLVQLAGSFAGRLAPGGLGGLGLNERYLERAGVGRPEAVGALGLDSLAGFVVHAAAIAVMVPGFRAGGAALRAPRGWPLLLAVAVLAVVVGAAIGLPWVRRRILGPAAVAARSIGAVLATPARAAALFGGSAGLTAVLILALDASLHAYGIDLPATHVALVYLVGAAVGSVAPTPGGLGVTEAALVAGLTGVGVGAAPAVAGVLTFRMFTFWLPVIPGAWALRHLRRADAV